MSVARRSLAAKALLLGCILFDVAMILVFTSVFSLFSILAPVKSLVMLLVLVAGLLIINVIVALPHLLVLRWGTAYAIALSGLGLLYALASNLLSVLLVNGSTIGYIVWELLLFAVFAIVISIVVFFSQRRAKEARRDHREQAAEGMTWALLMEIEELLKSKNVNNAYKPLVQSFDRLKERMQASTPFYRISGNPAVTDLEQTISDQLTTLHIDASMSFTEDHAAQMQKLIQEILRLVRQREQHILKNMQR